MTALAIIPYQQIPVIDLGRPAGSISQHGCDLSGPFQTRSLCTLVIFFLVFGGGHLTNGLCHGQDGK